MKLPDKVYNVLKWLTLIALPALATLYSAIEQAWSINIYGQEVSTTIMAVAAFIGILIGVSTYNYNKVRDNVEYDMLERTIGEEEDEEDKGE